MYVFQIEKYVFIHYFIFFMYFIYKYYIFYNYTTYLSFLYSKRSISIYQIKKVLRKFLLLKSAKDLRKSTTRGGYELSYKKSVYLHHWGMQRQGACGYGSAVEGYSFEMYDERDITEFSKSY